MIDCCVDNLKEIHAVADYTLGFQRFVMASPFLLLIPNFDPTARTKDQIQVGLEMAGSIPVSEAIQRVNRNQKLPDFVDTVANLGRTGASTQMNLCYRHSLQHAAKMESDYAAFWQKMGDTYKKAMDGKM